MSTTKRFFRRVGIIILNFIIAFLIFALLYWLGWILPFHIWNDPHSGLAHFTKIGFRIGFGLSVLSLFFALVACDRRGGLCAAGVIRVVESLGTCGILLYFCILTNTVWW